MYHNDKNLCLTVTLFTGLVWLATAAPQPIAQRNNDGGKYNDHDQYYDVQGHRGGRGQCVENTIASFAWGLISGATTLELDVRVLRYLPF